MHKRCVDLAALEIHIDGSGAEGSCWAFNILWRARGGQRFYGGHKTGPEYIGAGVADSNAAELSEFTRALLFALQQPCKECVLLYDSMFAANSGE